MWQIRILEQDLPVLQLRNRRDTLLRICNRPGVVGAVNDTPFRVKCTARLCMHLFSRLMVTSIVLGDCVEPGERA